MFLLSELFFSSSETTLSSATKQLPMVVYLLLLGWEVWTIRFQWAPQDQDEDPEVVPALLGWMCGRVDLPLRFLRTITYVARVE